MRTELVASAAVVSTLALALFAPALAQDGFDTSPLSPSESMRLLHVREGFEVELVAAEPAVVDPVAIDWGADGSLWVAEMADYPLGVDGAGAPGGRIRRLRDTNQDGHYDQSTLFLDSIPFPTGLLTWGKGILVTAAPEIFYAEDSDGDGSADLRQVLYSGFLTGNQQLRVNGLRWGLDNWIYCASGSHHAGYGKESRILSHATGRSTHVGSRDFRIRPQSGLIDPQSGPSQYGRNRDDWGNWFGVQNSYPLWHYVLTDHDIRRNRSFAPPDPRQQVITPANPLVYPAKSPQKRFHSFNQSGRFTSACSAIIYRDDLLFDRGQYQHAFTCEPFHNLVQHNVISEAGVTFQSQRDPSEGNIDFFASADRWCRPVMVRTGPDGALWVVDMYRYMIEHPEWLPEAGRDELRPFYRAGDDCGRIYRIFPAGGQPRDVPSLDGMSSEELVELLESSNGWQRDKAQQLLVLDSVKPVAIEVNTTAPSERSVPRKLVTSLETLVRASDVPLGRLHALCTLDGLDALALTTLTGALTDQHAGVRRHAVRLAAQRRLDVQTLAPLAEDPDPKVRLELACTLGNLTDPSLGKLLLRLAVDGKDNRFVNAALCSSLNERNIGGVFAAALDAEGVQHRSPAFWRQLFAQVAALGGETTISEAFEFVCRVDDAAWRLTALADLLDGLEKRSWALSELDDHEMDKVRSTIDRSRVLVRTADQPLLLRCAAARLLLRQPDSERADLALLTEALVPQTPAALQEAVVAHMASRPNDDVAAALLAGWKSHSPVLRRQIISALISRESWVGSLIGATESRTVLPSEIGPAASRRLLASGNLARDSRIRAMLSATTSDRQHVVRSFRVVSDLDGDVDRGTILFKKHCTSCHKHGSDGHEVGPNLAALTDKSTESLLASILDPSAAVEGKYLDFMIVSTDGRSFSGMLATETGASITLLAAEGKQISILRSEIELMQSTGKSLMPDGWEKELSPQDLADLIEFIRVAQR